MEFGFFSRGCFGGFQGMIIFFLMLKKKISKKNKFFYVGVPIFSFLMPIASSVLNVKLFFLIELPTEIIFLFYF